MILSKVFRDTPEGERLFVGYDMRRLPVNGRHHMYSKQVAAWGEHVTIADGKFTFHHPNMPDTVFTIDHGPGTYSCHDGNRIDAADTEDTLPPNHANRGAAARAYVAAQHKGKASPDKSHPAGFKVKDYYGVTLEVS